MKPPIGQVTLKFGWAAANTAYHDENFGSDGRITSQVSLTLARNASITTPQENQPDQSGLVCLNIDVGPLDIFHVEQLVERKALHPLA
jgi:hypothetical protein